MGLFLFLFFYFSSVPSLEVVTNSKELHVDILAYENFTLQGRENMYFFPLKLKQAEDTKSGSKFDFCLEARLEVYFISFQRMVILMNFIQYNYFLYDGK